MVTESAGRGGSTKYEWPISGGASSGLLECVARASCLPSLPERLAERTTTFLLTLLFVLRFGPRARDIQGSEPEASGSENDLVELERRREGGGCFAVPPPRTTYHA